MVTKFSRCAPQKAALSPLMVAAWLVALPVLTVVSVVNLKLASTPFFFVARDLSPVVLAALWIVLITVALLVITVLVGLARKVLNARHYQIFVGFAVFAVGLFFLGNVVANSSGITSWQPFMGGPIRWLLLIAASVVTGLFVLFAASGLLTLLSHRRVGVRTSRSDILSAASQPQTAAVLALLWVLILGYLLANPSLFYFQPFSFTLGRWGLAALAAGIFALIVWRLSHGGLAVLGIAGVVAIAPLVLTVTESDPYRDRVISYKPDATTPNILWVVVDELQSPALFDADGKVLDIFPNLAALQERSTTYSNAYMTAAYTDNAVPTMLNGVADPNRLTATEMRQVQRSSGILSWLQSRYDVLTKSFYFNTDFRANNIAANAPDGPFDPNINPLNAGAGAVETASVSQEFVTSMTLLAKDLLAVAGRLTLHPRIAQSFPELEGRWTNFWEDGPNARDEVVPESDFGIWLSQVRANENRPVFAFWHHMGVHIPLSLDLLGARIPRPPLNWNIPLSETEVELTKRLYLAAMLEFDRKLGQTLEVFDSLDSLDNTAIIISSDHGRTFEANQHFRGEGGTLEARWSEVANIPLIFKYPGQEVPKLVEDRKSNGQIAASILELAGVETLSGPPISPGLDAEINPFPPPHEWSAEEAAMWFAKSRDFAPSRWSTELIPLLEDSNFFQVVADLPDVTASSSVLMRQATTLGWKEQISDSRLIALQVTVDPRNCLGSEYGYVKAGNRFIGSVIWTQVSNDAMFGWGLMPASLSEQPDIWCS